MAAGLVAIFLLAGQAAAQVNFAEVTTEEEMEAAQAKASDQMLMLFVDVYATWCGPCKVMDSQVYSQPEVGEYMNANFISVKLDGESEYGAQFAAAQQLQGYPSMFIFSREGEPVSTIIGYNEAGELLDALQGTVGNYQEMKQLRTKYSRGTLEPGEFSQYITTVRKMGNDQEAERLSGEYLKTLKGSKLTDDDLRVVAFHMDVDDDWWPTLSDHPGRVRKALGDDFMLAMEKIYNNSLVKAVEEQNLATVSKMANELAPMIRSEETGSWDLRSLPFIQYYYYTDQLEELISYVDERFGSDRRGDHEWLFGAASQITSMDQQYRTGKLLNKEVEWFQSCIDLKEHFDYYFYHGMVLFLLNKGAEAKESLVKARGLAGDEDEKELVDELMGYVETIQ